MHPLQLTKTTYDHGNDYDEAGRSHRIRQVGGPPTPSLRKERTTGIDRVGLFHRQTRLRCCVWIVHVRLIATAAVAQVAGHDWRNYMLGYSSSIRRARAPPAHCV